MLRDQIKELVLICSRVQFYAQLLHDVTDIFVISLLPFGDGLVVGDQGKAVDPKIFFDRSEIIMEQISEDPEVILRDLVHAAAFGRPHAFAGHGERILICDHHKCQIILPQIPVEPIIRGDIQKAFDLDIDPLHKIFRGCVLLFPVPVNMTELGEDTILPEVAIQNQFCYFFIH